MVQVSCCRNKIWSNSAPVLIGHCGPNELGKGHCGPVQLQYSAWHGGPGQLLCEMKIFHCPPNKSGFFVVWFDF